MGRLKRRDAFFRRKQAYSENLLPLQGSWQDLHGSADGCIPECQAVSDNGAEYETNFLDSIRRTSRSAPFTSLLPTVRAIYRADLTQVVSGDMPKESSDFWWMQPQCICTSSALYKHDRSRRRASPLTRSLSNFTTMPISQRINR